jgi:mannose-6-phosphate isomerase-like protein (cupin superfamily)
MDYHVIDPSALEPFPNREADPRSISEAVGMERRDAKLGLRTYSAAPGEQIPMTYHYHDEQVEAFYVIEGALHVETPEKEFTVSQNHVFVAEPGSPHRAFNPESASSPVRVLAIGAPSVEDHHVYDLETDEAGATES